jgi:dephospho-CoA kinase
MGKSTVAQILKGRGVPVVDTDDLARKVVEKGQPALDELRVAFGEEAIGSDGCLRRAWLAELVFADAEARRNLEAILHPRIMELWRGEANRWLREGCRVGVVVIPLLFETNSQDEFDATICVACSAGTQMKRLNERGWSREESNRRIGAQLPIERKMHLSEYVLWTEGRLVSTEQQLKRLFPTEHVPPDRV